MGMALNRAAFMRKARRFVASFIPFILAVSSLSAISVISAPSANAATVTAVGTNPEVCNQTVGSNASITANRITISSVDYCVIEFRNTAETTWTKPSNVNALDILIVGAGGGGGQNAGAGGGGGGFLSGTISATSVTTLNVLAGAGGAGGGSTGGTNVNGGTGGFSRVTSTTPSITASATGGNGGTTYTNSTNSTVTAGGNSFSTTGLATSSTSQGAAGGRGSSFSTEAPVAGSNGNSSAITGTSWNFGAGGGGGGWNAAGANGGNYSGGNGGNNLAGTAGGDLGAGGGGGGASQGLGGNGAVGIVILRYKVPITITFSSNYGTSTSSTQIIPNSTATNLTGNTFTRAGYSFAGWNTNADGTSGTNYADGGSITSLTSTTLYAKWSANSCSVTPVVSGGFATVTFTSVGDCVWNTPTGVTSLQILVVGAGGGGGNDNGGGGGGGRVIENTNVTAEAGSPLVITVGQGGLPGCAWFGSNNSDSSNLTTGCNGSSNTGGNSGGKSEVLYRGTTYSALGGQGAVGRSRNGGLANTAGISNGYHGGGVGINRGAASNQVDGANAGGTTSNSLASGGGGGNGGAGANGGSVSQRGGAGGSGTTSAITNICYGGGGGGGADGGQSYSGGTASCGGAAGTNSSSRSNATSNLGGGGGGGGNVGGVNGGTGGSGVVIVRYANNYTITYNYNGADGGNSTATSSFTSGGTAITLPVPTRTGFTFAGWFETVDFSSTSLGSTYSPTQTRTIYAKWTGTVATLSGLTLSSGTLSPTFESATTSYTTSVVNSVSSITVTPTRTQENATITVNGTAVTSGSASSSISLNVGSNTITIIVTAQSGSTTGGTYTLTVTRLAAAVAPTIGTQPISLARTVGQSVSFIVAATASDSGDLSYQWQKGGVNIANATSPTYTFTTSSTSDAGNYQVIVTNTKNSTTATTTSNVAKLAVAGTNNHRNFARTTPSNVLSAGRSFTSSGAVIPTSGSFTIEGWFRENAVLDNQNPIFAQGTVSVPGFGLMIASISGRKLQFFSDSGTLTSSTVIAQGKWYHFAVTYDSSGRTLKLFLNGTEIGSISSATPNLTGSFYLGRNNYYDSHFFHGQQDQFKVWTSALTASEIATSMHAYGEGGITGKSLRTLYDFNQSSGDTATDVLGSFDLSSFGAGTSNTWASSSLVVTFDEQGGSPAATDTTFDFYSPISDPGNPSRTGFTFSGWSRTSNGSLVTFPYIFSPLEAVTLYAIWQANVVTPTIGTQPNAAAKTVGQSVTFTVAASTTDAGTLSYQWQKLISSTWTNIANATSTSYTFTTTATSDAGDYRVVVTNTLSGSTATTTSNVVA
jgi:uncharacterized repeat protein (TIGR02543 family)